MPWKSKIFSNDASFALHEVNFLKWYSHNCGVQIKKKLTN